MTTRTLIVVGATSVIAEAYAGLAAQHGDSLVLVGRDETQLTVIASDLSLRYGAACRTLVIDLAHTVAPLLDFLATEPTECDLFLAHSLAENNEHLSLDVINALVQTNIQSTVQMIHAYRQRKQRQMRILFLSSVAACRGRAKNSLYGASKAAIEVYLEGLQQACTPQETFTIARLGFIDTQLTYGAPGIFYAASPAACAQACWRALGRKKRLVYYPFFWRYVMLIIKHLPFGVYHRMNKV